MPRELSAAALLTAALRQLYDRPPPPVPWRDGFKQREQSNAS